MNTERKICLVTGANQGIGFAISKEIVAIGHKLIMVCRNEKKAQKAIDKLQSRYSKAEIDLVIGDLSSIKQIKVLGQELSSKYTKLDVLFHNAGVWPTRKEINEDGFEKSFVVNHLAVFQLTYDLINSLKAANNSRIVFINAGLILNAKFDVDKTPYGDNFSAIGTYGSTKLATVLFMHKLVKKLDGTGILANALHPGVFRTGLGEQYFIKYFLKFFKIFMKSTKKAAVGPIYLGFSQDVKSSGVFYDVTNPIDLPENASDPKMIEELWDLSEKILSISW